MYRIPDSQRPLIPRLLTVACRGQHQGINVTEFTDSITSAIAASNALIDQKLHQDGAGDALLTDVSAIQKIIQANEAPHAADDFATATSGIGGTASADAAHGVLANDSDPDGDTLVVTGFTSGSHGSLVFSADGSYSYTATDLTGRRAATCMMFSPMRYRTAMVASTRLCTSNDPACRLSGKPDIEPTSLND
jgi:hypothetical protein